MFPDWTTLLLCDITVTAFLGGVPLPTPFTDNDTVGQWRQAMCPSSYSPSMEALGLKSSTVQMTSDAD